MGSTNLPSRNPTGYLGIKETNPPQLYFIDRAPTQDDSRPYDAGDMWIDPVSDNAYLLIKKVGSIATWHNIGTAVSILGKLTGDTGGPINPDVSDNINLLGGTGISTTGNPGTNTITFSATGGGMGWTEITTTSVSMTPDNGYVLNNAVLVTATLPVTCPFGSKIKVVGKGAGGWKIAQNAGQTIKFGKFNTTTGVGGSLDSTDDDDVISLLCTTADTDFTVMSAIGNITII